MAHITREEGADQSTRPKPEGATTLAGTPTKWRALKKAVEAKRTQDMGDTDRDKNADLSTQTKPEGPMTPPGTPMKWSTLQKTTEGNTLSGNHSSTEWRTLKKAIEAERTQDMGGVPPERGTPIRAPKPNPRGQ